MAFWMGLVSLSQARLNVGIGIGLRPILAFVRF